MSAKILIVEDNPDSCAYLSHLLKVKGYTVSTAADGLQALTEIQNYRPDIVISDITMPRLDGIQMVRALREIPEYRDIPIIMISAYGSGNLREAIVAGANSALQKPLDFDLLFDTLEKSLPK